MKQQTVPFDWAKYKKGGWKVLRNDGVIIGTVEEGCIEEMNDPEYPLSVYFDMDTKNYTKDGFYYSDKCYHKYNLSMFRVAPETAESGDPSTWEYPCQASLQGSQLSSEEDRSSLLSTVVAYAKGEPFPFIVKNINGVYIGYKNARRITEKEITQAEAEAMLKEWKGETYKIIPEKAE